MGEAESEGSTQTNLPVSDSHEFEAPFILRHRRLSSRSAEYVGDDYGSVRAILCSLLLFIPVDHVAGGVDVRMRRELQSGQNFDSAAGGEGTRPKRRDEVGVGARSSRRHLQLIMD